MLNSVYKLVKPYYIEKFYYNLDLMEAEVIVQPSYLSICNADQRYYQGKRDEKILREKLPMALIHEGIGTIVYDKTNTYKKGDRVVIIPNQPIEKDCIIEENYLRSSLFCSSNKDGFMQDYISLSPDRLVAIPSFIPSKVAAFTELVSVSYHVINRFRNFAHPRVKNLGVFGDGNLGFITALLLKKSFPQSNIYVFGIHDYKLERFVFADCTYSSFNIPDNLNLDHAFECVGGSNSGKVIDKIIDIINPQGTVSLMGVSEEKVQINTRMILEKGLIFFGSSRSGRNDFVDLINFYIRNKEVVDYLNLIVGSTIEINSIFDIENAFNLDISKDFGKTILKWNNDGGRLDKKIF